MLNAQELVYELLKPIVEPFGAALRPDLRMTGTLAPPLVTFTIRLGAAINDRGMESPTAWSATLDLSWFHDSEQAVFDMASATYDAVHSWNNPFRGANAIVPGLGHATEVSDRSLPSLIALQDLPGHRIVQYSGGFDLNLHEATRSED